jgi:hypothetical protein
LTPPSEADDNSPCPYCPQQTSDTPAYVLGFVLGCGGLYPFGVFGPVAGVIAWALARVNLAPWLCR